MTFGRSSFFHEFLLPAIFSITQPKQTTGSATQFVYTHSRYLACYRLVRFCRQVQRSSNGLKTTIMMPEVIVIQIKVPMPYLTRACRSGKKRCEQDIMENSPFWVLFYKGGMARYGLLPPRRILPAQPDDRETNAACV